MKLLLLFSFLCTSFSLSAIKVRIPHSEYLSLIFRNRSLATFHRNNHITPQLGYQEMNVLELARSLEAAKLEFTTNPHLDKSTRASIINDLDQHLSEVLECLVEHDKEAIAELQRLRDSKIISL